MGSAYTGDGRRRSSMTHARRGHPCALCGRIVFGNGGQVAHGRGHVRRGEAIELVKHYPVYPPMTTRLFLAVGDERRRPLPGRGLRGDPMTTTSDVDQVDNRRVRRLLELALKYGYGVQASEHVAGCWSVFRAAAAEFYYGERHLNVYAGSNHSCVVYLADDPGGREHAPITQAHARLLLVEGTL